MEKFRFLSKEKITKFPKTSGVYAFKGKNAILYIGKATNIKERVKNHFSQPTYKDNYLTEQTQKVGFIKTGSEIEALILEANLIKKYKPKYNVVWKDDKNYFYVAVTKENFSKIFVTHQKNDLGINYIGPFVDGNALKQTLKILRKIFSYRTCNNLPKKPCLWYQLNRCPAPCILKYSLAKQIPTSEIKMQKEYKKNIKNLIKILEGKKNDVAKGFHKEMKQTAKIKDFEKAGKIRDKIWAIKRTLSHSRLNYENNNKIPELQSWEIVKKELQNILKNKKGFSRIEAYDISNIQGKNPTGSMVSFLNGKPDKKYYRKFKIKSPDEPNDTRMLREVLERRFNHPEWPYPKLILIDGGKPQINAAISVRNQRKLAPISVLALAKKNNELFIEGQKEPILLKNLSREFSDLILHLRDEAHRFARKYHLKLRKKAFIVN